MKDNKGQEVTYLCLICKKPTKAFYGKWGGGGTCCKSCELVKSKEMQSPPERKIS